jgi:hypothetical protein
MLSSISTYEKDIPAAKNVPAQAFTEHFGHKLLHIASRQAFSDDEQQ